LAVTLQRAAELGKSRKNDERGPEWNAESPVPIAVVCAAMAGERE
jgi:hypothetical protein